MQPVLSYPDTLPPHDVAPDRLVPHRIVAEWPVGTFVENVAPLADGSFLVTILSDRRVDRVYADGRKETVARYPSPALGVALDGGAAYVLVGNPKHGEFEIWRYDLDANRSECWMSLPGMLFGNGAAPLSPGALLITDSLDGRVYRADLDRRTLSVWIEDERLRPEPGIDLPGANGVRRWRDEVTISSSGRALLLRCGVRTDGSAGPLQVVAERLRVDDFEYDTAGNLYLATHVGHSLDRLDREGDRVTLAGSGQGLAGSTACAFGTDGALYVTTDGGLLLPPGAVVQSAKLVRLDVGGLAVSA